MILVTLLGRFIGIFILPCFLSLIGKEYSLNFKELWIIWYSGIIKGSLISLKSPLNFCRYGGVRSMPDDNLLSPPNPNHHNHNDRDSNSAAPFGNVAEIR